MAVTLKSKWVLSKIGEAKVISGVTECDKSTWKFGEASEWIGIPWWKQWPCWWSWFAWATAWWCATVPSSSMQQLRTLSMHFCSSGTWKKNHVSMRHSLISCSENIWCILQAIVFAHLSERKIVLNMKTCTNKYECATTHADHKINWNYRRMCTIITFVYVVNTKLTVYIPY